MRGWERVGSVAAHEWNEIAVADFGACLRVERGDVIAVSPVHEDELRYGTFQVASIGEDIIVARGRAGVRGNIPSLAFGDNVYRATAIGERVFKQGVKSC